MRQAWAHLEIWTLDLERKSHANLAGCKWRLQSGRQMVDTASGQLKRVSQCVHRRCGPFGLPSVSLPHNPRLVAELHRPVKGEFCMNSYITSTILILGAATT